MPATPSNVSLAPVPAPQLVHRDPLTSVILLPGHTAASDSTPCTPDSILPRRRVTRADISAESQHLLDHTEHRLHRGLPLAIDRLPFSRLQTMLHTVRMVDSGATFTIHSEPTALQQRCFDLLGVTAGM